MNTRDNIQDELNGLNSNLPSDSGQTPFSVPEGYFDGLAASVMAKIKAQPPVSARSEIAELSPLLAGLSRNMPYSVPAGYFQTTVAELPILTAEDPPSAILSLVERVTPYAVPAHYFDNLPESVLNKIAPKARVVPMIRRKWMRLAAAVLTGVIALSGYFYFSHKSEFDANKPIASQLKNVSIKELDAFINTTDITSSNTETVQVQSAAQMEVEKMLKDVSDKELDAFLRQMPADDLLFN